jgi:hypothetical protein
MDDGKLVHMGGVEWPIEVGIPYHGPTLRREVNAIVGRRRAKQGATR